MKNLQGKYYKTASGYDSYELCDADASYVFKLATIAVEVFKFTPTVPIMGLEQLFIELVKDETKISVGWDIWSGCYVMAHDKAGDQWVSMIGKYVEEML